jgi:hypothetical protein
LGAILGFRVFGNAKHHNVDINNVGPVIRVGLQKGR